MSAYPDLDDQRSDRPRASVRTGLAALAALIFTALSLQQTKAQLQVNEQGQITDRDAKAIEQLGSAERDIRLGGVYALERLSRDSPPDQPTIMDVLVDFVHEHAQDSPPRTYKSVVATAPTPLDIVDIHAALTVIGRRNHAHDRRFTFNLRGADFHGRDLSELNLTGANLEGANLSDANLTGANLNDANLNAADLTDADMQIAHLSGARMHAARLSGCRLPA